MLTGALEEKAALLPADDDGIAVQTAVPGGAESADVLDPEDAPVRPGDGAGQHIAGGIKVGSDLNINTVRHGAYLPIQNSEFSIQNDIFALILNAEFLLN